MSQRTNAPVVWLLLGVRAGDNAQVRRLAQLLPAGDVQSKQLSFNKLHALPNIALGESVASLTPEARDLLGAPWPDLVVAAGKRSAPVALWIKKQSGGRTKLVHIGRPRAALAAFDLVLTTPQYGLPAAANVVELPLPLASPRAPSQQEVGQWSAEWAALPRPLYAVALGAAKFPIRFGAAEADGLAQKLNTVIAASGGSAIVLASPRSDDVVVRRIVQRLGFAHKSYAPFDSARNPYAAALALCDRLVVTSDSASMIADGFAAGKPVEVFRLPVSSARVAWNAKRGLGAYLARAGLLQPPRRMGRVVDRLLADGQVGELGGRPAASQHFDVEEQLKRRLEALINSPA